MSNYEKVVQDRLQAFLDSSDAVLTVLFVNTWLLTAFHDYWLLKTCFVSDV